jgi:hypothetical protein
MNLINFFKIYTRYSFFATKLLRNVYNTLINKIIQTASASFISKGQDGNGTELLGRDVNSDS